MSDDILREFTRLESLVFDGQEDKTRHMQVLKQSLYELVCEHCRDSVQYSMRHGRPQANTNSHTQV